MNCKRNCFWLEGGDGQLHGGKFEPRLWLDFATCGKREAVFQEQGAAWSKAMKCMGGQ